MQETEYFSIGDDGKYELESELVEMIEKSKLDIETKISLILIKLGLKPSSSHRLNIKSGSDVFLTDEEFENIKSVMQKVGLVYDIKERVIETFDFIDEMTSKKISREMENAEIIISRSENDLRNLKTIDSRLPSPQQVERGEYNRQHQDNNYRELGRAYGYPESAVEAFIKYVGGDKSALIEINELSNDVQEDDGMLFVSLFFAPSRNNWQEEVKLGRIWANAVKLNSPKIYEEAIKMAKSKIKMPRARSKQ